jgi:monoamine oxidase
MARQTGCGLDEAGEWPGQPVTRRSFLGAAGAGALAGTGMLPRRAVPARSGRGSPRVVIVGSGIAGLGCAYRLWARYGIKAEVYENMVNAYLRGFGALFPHIGPAFNGRSYSVWSPADPHILGAYSYLAVGQYTAFNGIQGQRQGNVHFAGEQTSLNYQRYLEGALRSGYRCATEVDSRG